MKLIGLTTAGLALFSAAFPAHAAEPAVRRARGLMGTVLAVEVAPHPSADAAINAAFEEIARLEGVFSLYRPASELSLFNRAPAGTGVRVSPDLYELAAAALDISSKTGGAFDPTVEPLAKFWRVSREWSAGEWAKASEAVGSSFITVHSGGPILTRTHAGAGLNFDGIAKGLALDRGAEAMRAKGVPNAIMNFGGQILVSGRAADVAIADPVTGRPIARFMLTRGSAATSSQGERSRSNAGRSVGHIIDARAKEPSERMGSVTVVAPTALEADALSTALFVLGPIDGLRLLADRFPQAAAVWTEPAGIGWRLIPSPHFPSIQVVSGAADVALLENNRRP